MKKYQEFTQTGQSQAKKQKLDELLLFQYLLRNCAPLNEQYHGKAEEIAEGLQPWIDALKITLNE